jgi:wyosine [tRNA(Phe)-imidazoG37] synthetase (radical SAM superfamily)
VAHALRRALERLPAVPDWITFSGNGEPTLHPRFPVVVARVLAVRAELAPGARTAVLSNGLTA